MFSISVYPLLEHYESCIEQIGRVFGAFKYTHPITEQELAKARANLKADYCYQQETIDGLAKSLGYGLTTKFQEFYDDLHKHIHLENNILFPKSIEMEKSKVHVAAH